MLYGLGAAESGQPFFRGPELKPSLYPHLGERSTAWSPAGNSVDGRPLPQRDEAHARDVAAANGLVAPDGALLAPVVGSVVKLPAPWTDDDRHRADLQLPFFKRFCLDLGLLLLPFAILVIVGASNAVNFTDSRDGLAIGCTATVAVTLTVTAYIVSRVDLSRDLFLFHVPEAGELAIIGAALVRRVPGASSGSTATRPPSSWATRARSPSAASSGCSPSPSATSSRLFLAGGLFVAEAGSVVLQRSWFKLTKRAAIRRGDPNPTGRRIFRCAPLHHHVKMGGHHENKVTVRFWIVSVICAVLALAAHKIR